MHSDQDVLAIVKFIIIAGGICVAMLSDFADSAVPRRTWACSSRQPLRQGASSVLVSQVAAGIKPRRNRAVLFRSNHAVAIGYEAQYDMLRRLEPDVIIKEYGHNRMSEGAKLTS